MKYHRIITLKNGQEALLRNGLAADGKAVLENFNLAHAETDYLLSYPDENSFTAEQEATFLAEKSDQKILGTGHRTGSFRCLYCSRTNGFQELILMRKEL